MLVLIWAQVLRPPNAAACFASCAIGAASGHKHPSVQHASEAASKQCLNMVKQVGVNQNDSMHWINMVNPSGLIIMNLNLWLLMLK